jgi:hypothetical protein
VAVTWKKLAYEEPVFQRTLVASGALANTCTAPIEVLKLYATGSVNLTDIGKNKGSNLWTNIYTYADEYNTFTKASGVSVSNAVHSSGSLGQAGHGGVAVVSGKPYRLIVDVKSITVGSVGPAGMMMYSGDGSEESFSTGWLPTVLGVNLWNYIADDTGSSANFYFYNADFCQWAADFSLYEQWEGLIKVLIAEDSNITVKHNTNYIVLKGAEDLPLDSGDILELVSMNGVWIERNRVLF